MSGLEKNVTDLSHEEILRYSRHLLLPEVGLDGQRKLKAGSVLVIGAGGLGSPVALYLAAAGVGRIGLVDFDVVEYSNLQRQVLHGMGNLGEPKVESARKHMLGINPDIQVDVYNEAFTPANALNLANSYDVIVDASDNFQTRYLSNDVCVLTGKPNVYGSIFRFEGQASVFYAKKGPCYRCIFPEPPPADITSVHVESGVLGVLPGTIGTIQATEALKLILGIGEPLIGKLLIYNALDMTFEYVKLRKNPQCKICGEHAEITTLIDQDANNLGKELDQRNGDRDHSHLMTPLALFDLMKHDKDILLLDIREPHELQISNFVGARNIPLRSLAARLPELDNRQTIIVFCRNGEQSRKAIQILMDAGFEKVKTLSGGINAWAKEVDSTIPIY